MSRGVDYTFFYLLIKQYLNIIALPFLFPSGSDPNTAAGARGCCSAVAVGFGCGCVWLWARLHKWLQPATKWLWWLCTNNPSGCGQHPSGCASGANLCGWLWRGASLKLAVGRKWLWVWPWAGAITLNLRVDLNVEVFGV